MTPAHPCPSAPPRVLPGAANSPGVSASGAFPKLRVLDLFAGSGGFTLGLERTGGFETVGLCEVEPFARGIVGRQPRGSLCD